MRILKYLLTIIVIAAAFVAGFVLMDKAVNDAYNAGYEYGTQQAELGICTDLGAGSWEECEAYIEKARA